MAARLQQLRVMVADVEPLRFSVLIGVDELVRQVLADGVFTLLNPDASDYSRIICAWLRLHPEELPEQNPVGLDPHKGLAEVREDGDVEDPIGVEVEVLDVVVPEHSLEEVACRQCESTLHEPREHQDLIQVLLHRVRVPVAVHHRSISFSGRNLLLTRVRRSSVFSFSFFHSFAGLGRGGRAVTMTTSRCL
jgi:hypothetical protein